LRKKLVKCYIWSIALCGAETWTLRAVDQKHLENVFVLLGISPAGKYPKEQIHYSKHGESLKSRTPGKF
jgi:hypothetical protein